MNRKIIIKTIEIYIEHLLKLYNACLTEGDFPDIFKVTKVLPIFKKAAIDLPENWQFQSYPFLVKFLKISLTEYLESNKILNCKEYGFRKKVYKSNKGGCA